MSELARALAVPVARRRGEGDSCQVIVQLQKIVDNLRTGKAATADAPSDLPDHCAPFLRTVLDVVCAGATPTDVELLRLKDVTVELVDLLVQELQNNRNIWSPHKRAAQDKLNGQLFDCLMRLRPSLSMRTRLVCWLID